MANDLSAVATPSPQPALNSTLRQLIVTADHRGYTLRAGTVLTEEQKSSLSQRHTELRRLEGTPATLPERLLIVTRLLAAYPAADVSLDTHKLRIGVMADALTGMPVYAVEAAARFWNTRQHPEGNENYAFPPSAPQLARLAVKAREEVLAEDYFCGAMLNAKVEGSPGTTRSAPAPEVKALPRPTPEELKTKYGEDWGISAAAKDRWWKKATTPEEMDKARSRLEQIRTEPVPPPSDELLEILRTGGATVTMQPPTNEEIATRQRRDAEHERDTEAEIRRRAMQP